MEVTHRLADDLRAFDVLAIGHDPQAVHRVEDAALGRFQAIAHIWESARNDHRHRVIKERILNFVGDVDLGDLFISGKQRRVAHWQLVRIRRRRGCVGIGRVGHSNYFSRGWSLRERALGWWAWSSAIIRLSRSRSSRNRFSYCAVSFGFRHLVRPSSSTSALPLLRCRDCEHLMRYLR